MNIQEALLKNFKELNVDKQKAALEFVKYLKYQQQNEPTSKVSLKGLWSDFNFTISEDDIATARQEMWGNFGDKEIEF